MASGDAASFTPQGHMPSFQLGQHDSKRTVPLTDLQYGHLLNQGVSQPAYQYPDMALMRLGKKKKKKTDHLFIYLI